MKTNLSIFKALLLFIIALLCLALINKTKSQTNGWTWMKGPSTVANDGTYGTKGTEVATNKPGGVESAMNWADGTSGYLWLLGGYGYAGCGCGAGYINSFWRYYISTN